MSFLKIETQFLLRFYVIKIPTIVEAECIVDFIKSRKQCYYLFDMSRENLTAVSGRLN